MHVLLNLQPPRENVMERTYLKKVANPLDPPSVACKFFEALEPNEWEELIRDLLSDAPEARRFFEPRDADLLPYAATIIAQDDTSVMCFANVKAALDLVFNEEIRATSPSAERFRKILFLAECVGVPLSVTWEESKPELATSS